MRSGQTTSSRTAPTSCAIASTPRSAARARRWTTASLRPTRRSRPGHSGLTNDPSVAVHLRRAVGGIRVHGRRQRRRRRLPAHGAHAAPASVSPPTDGAWIFAVRAVDDQANAAPCGLAQLHARRNRTEHAASRVRPATTSRYPTPSSSSRPLTIRARPSCAGSTASVLRVLTSVFTDPPLADGEHFLEVARDRRRLEIVDATPARITFRVDTGTPGPGPGDGPAPNPQNPPVQQAKIIIGSLVLISGNAGEDVSQGPCVDLSHVRRERRKCNGRLSITTAEPVSKRDRRLVTLGHEEVHDRGQQEAPHQRAILQVEDAPRQAAEALQGQGRDPRDRPERGNPRISTRVFVLRAR